MKLKKLIHVLAICLTINALTSCHNASNVDFCSIARPIYNYEEINGVARQGIDYHNREYFCRCMEVGYFERRRFCD